MGWRSEVVIPVGLVVLLFFGWASPQVINTNPDCRLCPGECLSVPRSDGSCSICICNGVALPDCPNLPDFCPRNCVLQRNEDGCNQCACRRQEPVICPPLRPCPEECQQLMDEDGCPRCLCDAPPRNCPAITCPDECTEEVGEDGCRSCRCQRTEICPAVRSCLRGCIDTDEDSGCFVCNCSLLSEDPVNPFGGSPLGGSPFGGRPFGGRPSGGSPFSVGQFGLRPFNADQIERDRPEEPEEDNVPSLSPRCRSLRLRCPPGCRAVVAAHGCRECMCGDDAFLCPGVPSCNRSCLFMSSEDRCCRCNCSQPPVVTGGFSIKLLRIPSFRPFRHFGQFGPIRPFGPFGPIRPNTGFDRNPFLPPFSPEPINPDAEAVDRDAPEIPERNCTVDPVMCSNLGCRVTTDSDGCPLCECPGDLCPRIRCPPRCVQQIGPNGCPDCNCGGRPEPINPDAEAVDPDAEPIDPEALPGPINPGVPLLPAEPVNPEFPINPTVPEDPFVPAEPVDPVVPAEPLDPVEPVKVTDPILPTDPDSMFESNLPTLPDGENFIPPLADVADLRNDFGPDANVAP